jgi:hypothetical protein
MCPVVDLAMVNKHNESHMVQLEDLFTSILDFYYRVANYLVHTEFDSFGASCWLNWFNTEMS